VVSLVGELLEDAFMYGFDADYMWVYLAVLGCLCILTLALCLTLLKIRTRENQGQEKTKGHP